MALGAAIAAVVLIGIIAVLLKSEPEARTTGPSASGATASSTSTSGGQPTPPASTPQQLKQRAEESSNPLAEGPGESMAEMLASEEFDNTELLSRFVHDSEGETIGETMTVTEDEVILKKDGEFLAVDPEAVIEKEGQLLLDPNVDFDEARQRGEDWREANLDRMEYDEEGLPED